MKLEKVAVSHPVFQGILDSRQSSLLATFQIDKVRNDTSTALRVRSQQLRLALHITAIIQSRIQDEERREGVRRKMPGQSKL